MPSQLISDQLGKNGLCVWPDFLSVNCLRNTRADFKEKKEDREFRRAQTGQGEGKSVQELRRDETHWLDREHQNSSQEVLWHKFDALKLALNRSLFLGINDFEGHYAAYPAGGFYRRHRDAFQTDDSRIVSLVLYLNKNWQEADGGKLRVYSEAGHTDISPVGGTLVCFFSRDSEHEVLVSHAERSSLAGWFKTNKSLS